MLVSTNVPYLARLNQGGELRHFSDSAFELGRNDMGYAFMLRCFELSGADGTVSIVTPDGWLSKPRSELLRRELLQNRTWNMFGRLGPGGFTSISGEVVQPLMYIATAAKSNDSHYFYGIDCPKETDAGQKAEYCKYQTPSHLLNSEQLNNPKSVISLHLQHGATFLGEYAKSIQGLGTSDNPPFIFCYWEFANCPHGWKWLQSASDRTSEFEGRQQIICWENGKGRYFRHAMSLKEEGRLGGWKSGKGAWGQKGVSIA
jgi:hypothetical protein